MSVLDIEAEGLLREAARKHAERSRDLAGLRARRGKASAMAPGHLESLRDQGWLDAFAPEDQGGMSLGLQAAAALVGPLASSFAVAPLDSHFLACRVLALAECWDRLGRRAQTPVLAFAFQERPGDVFEAETVGTVLGADGRLTGTKRYVAGLEAAELILVSARGSDGLALAAVEAGAPGVARKAAWRADGTPMDELHLTDAPARLLATGPQIGAAIAAAVDETSLLVGVELMAHVDAMMEMLLEHLRNRVQFGRPIGAFQALQHRAADLYVRQLLARSVLDGALPALAAGPPPKERLLRVARARARLNGTARLVAREAIQLFGAMGITDECDLGLHVKRVLALTGWLGTETQHRQRAARVLAAELAHRPTDTEETAR